MTPERRRLLLGLAHKAAAQLGMDEETRRAAQRAWAGHDSLKDFSDRDLLAWCWELKRRGADIGIPGPAPRGGQGWDRPTASQLAEIERLSALLGLSESAMQTWLRRSVFVDDARFLTRQKASQAITGLRRWAKEKR